MELSNKPFIHLFRTRNQYYFYDANTCSIIRINETMYDILKNKENFLELEQLKKLYENGFLQSKEDIIIEHPASSGIESYLDEGMQQLILQLTQNCNLRCKYCVYSGSYKNRVHTNKRMTFEIAKEAIDYYYLHSRAADVVRIGLYGGEALLEFDLIKKITEYCEKIFAGKELRINMTTNATLLNEKIVDFLQKHNFDLMISLDGPESVQNKSRVFADNSHGTFDVIIQKIEMIQKLYPQYLDKISFNAVIDEQNDFACSSNFFTYDFLKDAVVTAAGVSDRDSVQEVSLRETFYINYNYELFKSFIVYAGELDNKYISKLIVSHKGLLISSIHDRVTKPYRRKGICHPNGPCIAGYNRLFVTVEGKFYPCERVSETNEVYCIGDIKSGIETKKVLRLLNTGKLTETECKNCWALNLCSICAADFGEDNDLSTSKKLQKCSVAKKEVEEHLVEYCTLREYGFNFEN